MVQLQSDYILKLSSVLVTTTAAVAIIGSQGQGLFLIVEGHVGVFRYAASDAEEGKRQHEEMVHAGRLNGIVLVGLEEDFILFFAHDQRYILSRRVRIISQKSSLELLSFS